VNLAALPNLSALLQVFCLCTVTDSGDVCMCVYGGILSDFMDGLVAEWLACWTQAQKGPCSNRSRDAVG